MTEGNGGESPTPGYDLMDEPRPSESVRAELLTFLETDESRTGEVFRADRRGLPPDEIARELGVGTSNFVWNYKRTNAALLDGDLPSAPSVAMQAARRVRMMLRSPRWSPACREYLQIILGELERRADDPEARLVEDERAQVQTVAAESSAVRGIYVYALPHYLRYPFDAASGRTLMKVGRSDSDVIQRFQNQTRTTALPEEPILLRIYAVPEGDSAQVEREFHELLEAADHSRSVARTAGREWFVTSTRFLDRLAQALSLGVIVVNEVLLDDN